MRLTPLLLALSLAAPLSAQIRESGDPAALWADLRTEAVPIEFVQPPDVAAYMAEDEANGYRPLRYGALIPTPLGQDLDGLWQTAPDGSLVWRFGITSPGAYSIGLEFDGFWLPEGAQAFLYDPTLSTVYGAYGSINNQPNGQILLEPFPGDTVIFEYVQPPHVSESPLLHLGTVIHDYRDVIHFQDMPSSVQPGGADGSCLIDVACPEADGWEVQKRATVRTLSNGALCSGALINNTNDDGVGYVYTADHCGQNSNCTFRFNYQNGSCGSGGAPTNQNVSGCTVLATSSTFDSRLLRINNSIPSNYNPYYAGWTRSILSPTYAFSLGHPGGGPKKISIDGNGADNNGAMWAVNWSEGTLEGGSSGGPLFDQLGLVRGPACCVNAFVCAGQTAFYGRFDRFYQTEGLGPWLDPAGLNPTYVNGWDPQDPTGTGGTSDAVQIDSIDPADILLVNPGSDTLTLSGEGFEGVTSVTVGSLELAAFPPQFAVKSNQELKIFLPQLSSVGPTTITVADSISSDTVVLQVEPNLTPTVDLANSDTFLLGAIGAQLTFGGPAGDLMFVLGSGQLGATSLPGIFDLDIGAGNLAGLVYLGAYPIDAVTGFAQLTVPFDLPTGFGLHFQAAALSAAAPSLPLLPSNVESGVVLF